MNKACDSLLRLAMEGRGSDLIMNMAICQNLQDISHVFNPILTSEDKETMKLLSQVASALTQKGSNTKKFSAALTRGQWAAALESLTDMSKTTGLQLEETFSALLSLLYVPACYVDIFALSVIRKIGRDDIKTARGFVNTKDMTCRTVWDSWGQNQTREGLIRFAVAGAVLESRNPDALRFGLENDAERARFERYQKVLQYVAENNKAYSEVMRLVNQEKWKEANETAAKHLQKIGIKGGKTVDDPPALADFLTLAITPVGDPHMLAQAARNSVKKKE